MYKKSMTEWQYCTNGCTFVTFVKKFKTLKYEFTYVNLPLSSVNYTLVITDK